MSDVPYWLTDSARQLIEQVVARAVAMDPAAEQRLADLAGRSLRLYITDTDTRIDVHFQAQGVRLAPGEDATVTDTAVEASLAGLMSLAASRGQRGQDMTFRGDIGVIQQIKQLIGELEIDWEEQLSRITGDVVANRVGKGVRGGRRWAEHTRGRLLADLGEYLTEENRLLPTEAEVTGLTQEMRRLRARTDRLQARLNRLHHRRGD